MKNDNDSPKDVFFCAKLKQNQIITCSSNEKESKQKSSNKWETKIKSLDVEDVICKVEKINE